MINSDNAQTPVRTITHERKQPPNLTKIKRKRTQESTGEQAIKDSTAAAALEKEKQPAIGCNTVDDDRGFPENP